MAYERKDGDGVLFRNRDKKSDKHPDMSGELLLNGTVYRLVGWKKESKGKPAFLSLRCEPKRTGGDARSDADDGDDDCPF